MTLGPVPSGDWPGFLSAFQHYSDSLRFLGSDALGTGYYVVIASGEGVWPAMRESGMFSMRSLRGCA